jgi:hypothetical protein
MSTAATDLPPVVARVDDNGTQRITVFGTDTSGQQQSLGSARKSR